MGIVLKALLAHIFLLFLLGSVTTVLSENSTDSRCDDVSINLHQCSEEIRCGDLIDVPSSGCCKALRRIQDIKSTLGPQETCGCVKSCVLVHLNGPCGAASPRILDVNGANISAKIQNCCGVDLSFPISADAVC